MLFQEIQVIQKPMCILGIELAKRSTNMGWPRRKEQRERNETSKIEYVVYVQICNV